MEKNQVVIDFGKVNVTNVGEYHCFYRKESFKFSDMYVINEINVDKIYDVYKIYIPNPKTILDLGCNIGAFSLKTLSDHKEAKVWSFEINDSNYDISQYNRIINNLTKRWQAYLLGIGKKTGIRTFTNPYKTGYVPITKEDGSTELKLINTYFNPGGFSLKEVAKNDDTVDLSVKNYNGTTFVLDFKTILKYIGLKEIDLCKVDIERAELEVFPNLTNKLLNKVKVYVMEIHKIDDEDSIKYDALINYFIKNGFLLVSEIGSVVCFVRNDVLNSK